VGTAIDLAGDLKLRPKFITDVIITIENSDSINATTHGTHHYPLNDPFNETRAAAR